MTSLRCNFSGSVSVIDAVLLISASKIYRRLQPTSATRSGRFSEMHVHTACVAQQCLHANCLQMIQKQWPLNSQDLNPYRYVWDAMHEAFLKASSEAKSSFWIKIHTGEPTGKISAEKEPPWVSERGWESRQKAGGSAFPITQKSAHSYGVYTNALSGMLSVRQFLITSKLPSCHH